MGTCEEALNFGAGPAKLPREVLKEVQNELISYKNTGMSLMEMSHRSKEYGKINASAQSTIKELLNVPDNYKILFIHGGGMGAFAAVAMNLMNNNDDDGAASADYAITGTWSSKAAAEAKKYGTVNLVFPKAEKPGAIPPQTTWKLNPKASYFYYCDNETVDGVEFSSIPNLGNIPIVADMSSNIMTRKFDVSKFGCIFGGAQKNIGPAGVVLVIIREDLLGKSMPICPSIFDFAKVLKENSVLNTPATFSVYVMEKVLQWIKRNGGVENMEKLAIKKSTLLYETIKNSANFYSSPINENCRSRINVPFRVGTNGGDENLEEKFLKQVEEKFMFQLKGHRSVGGIRASLYNATSFEDVQKLVQFMKEFQKLNQQ